MVSFNIPDIHASSSPVSTPPTEPQSPVLCWPRAQLLCRGPDSCSSPVAPRQPPLPAAHRGQKGGLLLSTSSWHCPSRRLSGHLVELGITSKLLLPVKSCAPQPAPCPLAVSPKASLLGHTSGSCLSVMDQLFSWFRLVWFGSGPFFVLAVLFFLHGWSLFFPQDASLALSRGVWTGEEQSAEARATREGSTWVQLGEVVAGLGPCGPHSGRTCGKQGREKLQHRKGIDSSGVGLGGWGWAEEKQVLGSVGRSAANRPQPCPSGALLPPLTCPALLHLTPLCFFLVLWHLAL